MHIAGTATFDGGVADRRRRRHRHRPHPRLRRLAPAPDPALPPAAAPTLPLQQRPIWVDDPHFNIHYHVRHTALPKPGDERQLKRLAARIMAQHLDRSKPLWEIWFVEGLDGGDRFAMISKIHHCMVDGVSSVDLLNVLLQPQPIDEIKPAPDWMPRAGADGSGTSPARPPSSSPTWPARARPTPSRSARARRAGSALRPARPPARRCATCFGDQHAHACRRRRSTARSARTAASTGTRMPLDDSEGGEERARRHAQRRRARHRQPAPCGASSSATGSTVDDPRLPRHGAGQRAHRRRARHARQPRLGLDGAAAARRARPARGAGRTSARPPAQLKESKQALGAEVLAAGRRVDAVDAALARLAHADARPALQPRRHQRARPAAAALPARARACSTTTASCR